MSFGQELSPRAALLVEEAKQQQKYERKSRTFREGFNLAIISRFDGGLVFDDSNPNGDQSISHGFFNMTALEFYLPAFTVAPKMRILLQARFSMPILGEEQIFNTASSLYAYRLGMGVGFAQTIYDKRSTTGVGLQGIYSFVTGIDFTIWNRIYDDFPLFTGDSILYRFELGMKWNYFLSKHFAIVFGFDITGGFTVYEEVLWDSYSVEFRGFFTYGLTVGLMF